MTGRRAVVGVLAAGLATVVLPPVQAQTRVFRIGLLRPVASPGSDAIVAEGLGGLGYVEGRNLLVLRRDAEGRPDRLDDLAADVVRWKPDAIVAVGSAAVHAAMRATATIPIVMFTNGDPVAAGFVKSLAKPGGNVTGITFTPDGTLAGKKMQLLKEMVPAMKRVVFLSPNDPGGRAQVVEATAAAGSLGLVVVPVVVEGGDYAAAFEEAGRAQAQALFVAASTYFVRDRRQIIGLAAQRRIPAIYEWREDVQQGGLMTYATSLPEMIRRVAGYVDRIFKGAVPAEMPVEQPTKFELAINLKTARALNLPVPQSLLLRADEIVE